MKYKNLSTDLKIIDWFQKNPHDINKISEDGYHILDWVCFGYRGIDAYKNNLITQLILMGADIDMSDKSCFNYIFSKFLPLTKQPLNSSVVLEKLFNSNQLHSFQYESNLLDFFINNYNSHDFLDIKKQILFKNKSQLILEKIINEFSNSELTNKNFINFYDNIFSLLQENNQLSLSCVAKNTNITFFDIIKQKTPNIEICRSLVKKLEIIESYKSLNKKLLFKDSKSSFLKL